jgi:DNA invertase Pin-like site-specific DNA recombinase
VESGKRKDRPKLAEALKLCRLHGATLIIAKLDRLARNVAFTSNLMESGVDFQAVDFPQANRLTIHILAAVAEHEAKVISERTKAALAAAKRRGVQFGGYRGTTMTKAMRKAAAEAVAKRVNARVADLTP